MFALIFTFSLFIISSFLLISILVSLLRTGVPTLASAKAAQKQIGEYLNKEQAQLVYELGSGKGDFVFALSKEMPAAHIVGIELSPAPYIIAKIRHILHPNKNRISFRLADFHKIDLSKADAVAFYLMPGPNKKVQPKLDREMRKGTTVASVSFSMPDWEADEVLIAPNHSKTHSFIYTMPPARNNENHK